MTDTPRDRLRELLDAVLDEDNRTLDDMAGDAYASPYHFNRLLSRSAYEAPVAMRRRVMLERAAWQVRQGTTVTDAAWAAGYGTVEGFSRAFTRAFGHPPSAPADSHWLPAKNGIHFHPPMSLWVHTTEEPMNPLTEQLVEHDLDDTRDLLEVAKGLPEEEYRRVHFPAETVLRWDGEDSSIDKVLAHQVFTKEVWLAAIEGTDFPAEQANDPATLLDAARRRRPALAGGRPRHRPQGRLGRPADRRALRPAGELPDGQRRRPRADLRRAPPAAGAADAARCRRRRDRCTATRSTGSAPGAARPTGQSA